MASGGLGHAESGDRQGAGAERGPQLGRAVRGRAPQGPPQR